MNILFDLDGPLLDVSERYYRLYVDLMAAGGYTVLSKQEYWGMMRFKKRQDEILASTTPGSFVPTFEHQRRQQIESRGYLSYDRLFEDVIEVLETLSRAHPLYLITLRGNKDSLMEQLGILGLARFFSRIIVGPTGDTPWGTKRQLILTSFAADALDGIIGGDTEADILAGKSVGLTTVAISRGIRDACLLLSDAPDYLIESLHELIPIVEKLSVQGNTAEERNRDLTTRSVITRR